MILVGRNVAFTHKGQTKGNNDIYNQCNQCNQSINQYNQCKSAILDDIFLMLLENTFLGNSR